VRPPFNSDGHLAQLINLREIVPAGRIELRPVIENMEVAGSKRRQKPKTLKIPKTPTTGTYLEYKFLRRRPSRREFRALMM
jgi:hypothetical protein